MAESKNLDKYIDIIVDLYFDQRLSSIKIAKIYNVSHTAILDCLERHNYPRRVNWWANTKYPIDETYFNEINTPTKAYFLGFLYADGYCHDTKNIIALKIQERDGYILDLFNKELKTSKPLTNVLKQSPAHQNMVMLRINNGRLSESVKKLGLYQRKSLTLQFPNDNQIPPHLLNHFIRGYFDGDGCVMIPKGKITHTQIVICLTEAFGRSLQLILQKLNIKSSIGLHTKHSTIWRLTVGGRKQGLKFLNWIYPEGVEAYLIRKYEKYLLIKKYINKRKDATSKYNGVHFLTKTQKFVAMTEYYGKKCYFGSFHCEIEAAKAYNCGVLKLGIDRELNVF